MFLKRWKRLKTKRLAILSINLSLIKWYSENSTYTLINDKRIVLRLWKVFQYFILDDQDQQYCCLRPWSLSCEEKFSCHGNNLCEVKMTWLGSFCSYQYFFWKNGTNFWHKLAYNASNNLWKVSICYNLDKILSSSKLPVMQELLRIQNGIFKWDMISTFATRTLVETNWTAELLDHNKKLATFLLICYFQLPMCWISNEIQKLSFQHYFIGTSFNL